MLNRFIFNAAQFNQAVAAASSIDSGSTRSPFGHIVVAIPDGNLVLIYQQGTNGLCYRVSINGGTVWGAEQVIDAKTTVYASAIVNPTTKDVYVVYSNHGNPAASESAVYYRPLIWDSGASDWNVGGEQTLAGGGSLYDPAVAGRRNASISVGDDGFPVITYLRNEYGVVTWAMLVSQEAWALTDFDVDLDIGVAADEDSRGAAIQTTSRSIYFVSRTGSWYSLASATGLTNPIASTGIDMTVLFSWLGSESEMVAVARNDDGDRLGIVYLAGDGAPHFRLYNLTTLALVSDTEMHTAVADSVSITWDGAVFWMAWVANDNVRISNSDAPATVVQTFSNPGPDEDWSWLNSPVACAYTANVIFVWCATASSIYAGVFTASRAVTEAETGVGVDVAQIEITVAETGAGADSVGAPQVIDVFDTGRGFDYRQPGAMYNETLYNGFAYNQRSYGADVQAGPLVTDTGTGVDAAGKTVTVDENGAGVDAVQIAITGAMETGSGADSVSNLTELVAAPDTGTGVDALALGIAVADAGEGVSTEQTGPQFAEVGAGVDSAIIALTGAGTSGAGADVLTLTVPLTDTGTGVDDHSVDKQGNNETGSGADVAQIAVAVAETGSGADVVGAGNAIAVGVEDYGTGVDTPSVVWIPTAVVVRLLQHSGEVRLKIES